MRRSIFVRVCVSLIFCMLVAASIQAEAVPDTEPVSTYDDESALVDVFFSNLKQGRVGLVRLIDANLANGQITVFGATYPTFEIDGGRYAFVSVPMDQAIRTYEAQAQFIYEDDSEKTISFPLDVSSGGFIQQSVDIPGIDETILNPEIEANELASIFDIASQITEDALWDENGFNLGVNREFTSPFGAVRLFNGTYNTLHTGWDYQASTGESTHSIASGRVAFAGRLPIRGNYVLIDHGWGIYSGYAHMSVVFVTQGQQIYAGQRLGRVGSTGRSSSAHAHIEMIAHDNWVDVADFLRMYRDNGTSE